MAQQSFANHARYVFGFHVVVTGLLAAALVGSCYWVYRSFSWGSNRVAALSQLLLVVAVGVLTWYARVFPLKAQDRAIRAEEALRHYLLTGRPLDPRLRIGQVIALRFASDGELPELARRAAEEGLRPAAIKQAIQSWRADEHRV
jgi:hypothetical protein